MSKQPRKIGFLRDDDEPNTEPAPKKQDDIDEVLLDALNKLAAIYEPCTQQEATGCITTKKLYEQLQELYPSDYSEDEIVQALKGYGFDFFIHPVLDKFYWQVKKID